MLTHHERVLKTAGAVCSGRADIIKRGGDAQSC